MPAEDGVVVIGHVPCGEDIGIGCPAELIHSDPVGDFKARISGDLDIGEDPNADDHHISGEGLPVRADHVHDAPIASDPLHRSPGHDTDAVLAMERGDKVAHRRIGDPGQHVIGEFNHGHVTAAHARARRHFKTDKAAADDHHPSPLFEDRPERQRIGDGPDVVDTLKLRARTIEVSDPAAGDDQEAVVSDRLAAVQGDGLRSTVDRVGASLEAKLDPVSSVIVDRVTEDLVHISVRRQQLLGERRSLVRDVSATASRASAYS